LCFIHVYPFLVEVKMAFKQSIMVEGKTPSGLQAERTTIVREHFKADCNAAIGH